MGNRWVPAVLIALLLILHGQLWFGRGSIPNVSKLTRQLEEQKQRNAQASQANERLEAEIHDLKEGLEIVEEKARSELGMVKANEIYVQIAR
ncbi:Cell division protein FtsB [Curvibacter sp. AEP1-3]|jgi:cell division protein FtsB|uniref:septum formation initiator family protein n=1 Tax=Curvibacter sp. AEP1-3 TaxID=1844971 RepID=UPI000B3CA15C|nr:septum formation initiator family protein [Curvibacter sp. AEP1-3]ARV18068.1 Cell division protein FtsB [Curvibacter sp. AEP1-3]